MKLRSKVYFRNAIAKDTWALKDDPDSLAAKTLEIVMQIAKPRKKTCLSMACGWGRYLRGYLKHGAAQIVGIDINKSNLLRCKTTTAMLVQGDVENLPFKSETFDVAECMATMEHVEDPEKVMLEAKRVSRGKIFVSWNHYSWIRSLKDKTILMRLFQSIIDLTPSRIGYSLRNAQFPLYKTYGLFRNKGFSTREIAKIYARTNIPITKWGYSADEGIILVYSNILPPILINKNRTYPKTK